MSTKSERGQRAYRPRWRVTINGESFEGNFRLPTDALTAAMRKYLAGPRRRTIDGIECWERHAQPPEWQHCIGIVEGSRGEKIWLVPIAPLSDRPFPNTHRTRADRLNRLDPKSGAMPHAVHDDFAIFIERVAEEPGSDRDRYFRLVESSAASGKLGLVFGDDGRER